MNKNTKNRLIMAIISIGIMGTLALLVFLSFMGFFRLTNVHYESYTALLLYVVLVFIISFFIEIFAKLVEALIARNTKSKGMFFLQRFLIHSTANWFALFTADEFVRGIEVPFLIEIIIAILLFFIEEVFDEKHDKKKIKKNK